MDSYATGAVTAGESSDVDGLVGYNGGTVTASVLGHADQRPDDERGRHEADHGPTEIRLAGGLLFHRVGHQPPYQ